MHNHSWLFATLCTIAVPQPPSSVPSPHPHFTHTHTHHSPLSMGFYRQEYCSGLPCPPPRDLSDPGIKLRSPALQVNSLLSESPGKSISKIVLVNIQIARAHIPFIHWGKKKTQCILAHTRISTGISKYCENIFQ